LAQAYLLFDNMEKDGTGEKDNDTSPQIVDVVIIGAGVAGIAAASELIDRGYSVCVVESRSIIGGRARSWKDGKTKDPIHIGPHIVATFYSNFFKLLRRLKTEKKITWPPKDHFITLVKGDQSYSIDSLSWLPPPLNWVPGSFWDPFIRFGDKHTMVPAMIHCLSYDTEEKRLKLDNESGEHFLARLGVSDAAIYHFFAFLSHSILNVPISEVSAAALVRTFQGLVETSVGMGFADCGLGELLFPAHELLFNTSKANGDKTNTSTNTHNDNTNTDTINANTINTNTINANNSTGTNTNTNQASLLLNTEVTGFTGDASQCTGVTLDDGRTLQAKMGVISTLPPQDLCVKLPSEWKNQYPMFQEIEKLKPCKYISVYLWFDRKVSQGRQMWARTYSSKDLNCEFYDYSNIYTGTDANGIPWKERPSFIGSNIIDADRLGDINMLSDEDIIEGTLRELEEFFGTSIRQARVVHSMINRIPMAIHRPTVGTESIRPDQASPIRGLYLAGCWTNTGFPGSMESAARSGYLAVDRLLEAHSSSGVRHYEPCAVPNVEPSLTTRMGVKLVSPKMLYPFFALLSWLSGGVTRTIPRSKL